MGTTANYNWEYPDDGADQDVWGAINTVMFNQMDTDLKAVSVVANAASQTGFVQMCLNPLAAGVPTGYILANGLTIGNASSNGTNRANADTAALFTYLWNNYPNTSLPIYTSGGIASTRGANAAADYAANKALAVPELRAEFPRFADLGRMVDAPGGISRTTGTNQADQYPAHTHNQEGGATGGTFGGSTAGFMTNAAGVNGSTKATSSSGGTENSSENRPRNFSLMGIIKL